MNWFPIHMDLVSCCVGCCVTPQKFQVLSILLWEQDIYCSSFYVGTRFLYLQKRFSCESKVHMLHTPNNFLYNNQLIVLCTPAIIYYIQDKNIISIFFQDWGLSEEEFTLSFGGQDFWLLLPSHCLIVYYLSSSTTLKGKIHHILCGCPIIVDAKCSLFKQWTPHCVLYLQRKSSRQS